MSDSGYLALMLVVFCVDRECNESGDKICPTFKENKCAILDKKKEELRDRMIIMYEKDVVDIGLLKTTMSSMCDVCPMAEDCAKHGDFSCIAAKDAILGLKAEGKYLVDGIRY